MAEIEHRCGLCGVLVDVNELRHAAPVFSSDVATIGNVYLCENHSDRERVEVNEIGRL